MPPYYEDCGQAACTACMLGEDNLLSSFSLLTLYSMSSGQSLYCPLLPRRASLLWFYCSAMSTNSYCAAYRTIHLKLQITRSQSDADANLCNFWPHTSIVPSKEVKSLAAKTDELLQWLETAIELDQAFVRHAPFLLSLHHRWAFYLKPSSDYDAISVWSSDCTASLPKSLT